MRRSKKITVVADVAMKVTVFSDSVYSGRNLPIFWRAIISFSSRPNVKTRKFGSAACLLSLAFVIEVEVKSVNFYQTTRRHIADYSNLRTFMYRCLMFYGIKDCTWFFEMLQYLNQEVPGVIYIAPGHHFRFSEMPLFHGWVLHVRTPWQLLFWNPILFAICTSTFSKLCKNMYTVACRKVLTSTPL
jgi:hypothetical protein